MTRIIDCARIAEISTGEAAKFAHRALREQEFTLVPSRNTAGSLPNDPGTAPLGIIVHGTKFAGNAYATYCGPRFEIADFEAPACAGSSFDCAAGTVPLVPPPHDITKSVALVNGSMRRKRILHLVTQSRFTLVIVDALLCPYNKSQVPLFAYGIQVRRRLIRSFVVVNGMATRMPVVFFGHGNPLNALDDNDYTRGWRAIGESMPRPRAIVAISAHWYVPGTHVTTNDYPRTIHDFGGFPKALYDMQYPAPGDRGLAGAITTLLAPVPVRGDESWGLDHGTWALLCHVFPDASIPVLQLSIDETQPPPFHFDLGTRLRALRDEGILIAASGNLIHNLHTYAWGRHPAAPFDWAMRFEAQARELLLARRFAPLIDYDKMGRDAQLAAPTPDHYLPLLYAMGASDDDDEVSFPVEGIDGGSVSMLTVRFG